MELTEIQFLLMELIPTVAILQVFKNYSGLVMAC